MAAYDDCGTYTAYQRRRRPPPLPGVKRHRGHVLPDGAPERWEVEGG